MSTSVSSTEAAAVRAPSVSDGGGGSGDAAVRAAAAAAGGEIIHDYPLGIKATWFRVGGAARWFFEPADSASLAEFLRALDGSIAVHVIGAGTNTLVRDGGFDGVVIRLGRGFRDVSALLASGDDDGGSLCISAGAAALQRQVASYAASSGIAGFGFMRGIPGSVGGGVRMNAGAYGSEFRDVMTQAILMNRAGEISRLTSQQLAMEYRHCELPSEHIVLAAEFRGTSGDVSELKAQLEAVVRRRKATQPIGSRTGGSTFKNPPGHKAWQLIDATGLRGATEGSAEVSQMHCNFLIQHGDGRADDIETLGERVRSAVAQRHGIDLQWEVRRVGSAGKRAGSGE